MFTFIRTAIDYVVAKVTAAYQAVVNFFFAKEEKKETASSAEEGTSMGAAAAKAVLAFNQAIRNDESEANVVKAFQDAMIPGMNFDLAAKDAFRVIIDGMKLEATFDESTHATFFNYYRGVTPIVEKFATVTKLDVSEFYIQMEKFGSDKK
jgi:hypothetical protein